MKAIKAIIPIVAVFLLCGCDDKVEPNELAYVVAIGVDKFDSGVDYEYTIQVTNPIAIRDLSENGSSGDDMISNISVVAPSVFAAVNIANHSYSKRLSLAHTKLVAISEEIAETEDLQEFCQTLARSLEFRPYTYMSITECSAKEYLENIKLTNEVNPVQYYSSIFDSDFSSHIPKTSIRNFYINSMTPEKNSVLPLSNIKAEYGDTKINLNGFEYLMKDYLAGEVEAVGKEVTQNCGMAVFKGGKMVAKAGMVEAEIYNLLMGDFAQSEITFYDKNEPKKPVTLILSERKKPKIRVELPSDAPRVYIRLFLDAEIRAVSVGNLIEKNTNQFEEQIERDIKNTIEEFLYKTATEYESDIIGFGSYAKRYFKDFDEFTKFDWQEKYKNAEFLCEVDFKLKRGGLINREGNKA